MPEYFRNSELIGLVVHFCVEEIRCLKEMCKDEHNPVNSLVRATISRYMREDEHCFVTPPKKQRKIKVTILVTSAQLDWLDEKRIDNNADDRSDLLRSVLYTEWCRRQGFKLGD